MTKFLLQALLVTVIVAGISEAARVTKTYTFSAGQTIRSADVNKNFDDIYNEFNGSIEGGASGNIAADSITELEMADDINPRVRWDEGFQDWVYTGLQPATSASLTSDISAGTAYVNGYRVTKASATSKTYTDTKDTYVDIDYTGTFHYTEVARLAATPAVYTDSIRLAAVASTGGALVQVTDLRILTPYSTGSSKDAITRGFELEWGSTTTVKINPGTLYVNVTQVDTKVVTTLNITTAAHYIGGVSQQGVSKWLYVYVDNAGNQLLYATAPAFSDTSATTDGTKLYHRQGSTWYRCVGAIRLNATGAGEIDKFFQQNNIVMLDIPVSITTAASAGVWSAATSCATAIPPISTIGIFGIRTYTNSDAMQSITIRPNGSTWTTGLTNGLYCYGGSTQQRISYTDSAQAIQYQTNGGANFEITVQGYNSNLR